MIVFLKYFFAPSLLHIAPPQQEVYDNIGLRPALEKVQAVAQTCDIIWMEPTGQQPYMYYLFLTPILPEQFQQAKIEKNTDLWLNIKWFDNVRFGTPGLSKIEVPPTPGCDDQPSQTYFVTRRPTLPEDWQDIIVTHNDAGVVLWRAAKQTA